MILFIEEFIKNHGYSPSIRQIGESVGLRSSGTIWDHLKVLLDSGRLNSSGKGNKRQLSIPDSVPSEVELLKTVIRKIRGLLDLDLFHCRCSESAYLIEEVQKIIANAIGPSDAEGC